MTRQMTAECFLIDGDRTIPWGEVDEAKRAECRARWSERLSRNLSAYYAQNPEEYERLIRGGTCRTVVEDIQKAGGWEHTNGTEEIVHNDH